MAKKKLSVDAAAKKLFDGDQSMVWGAIADGSLPATVLAESQKRNFNDFTTPVTPEMAHRFMAGQNSIEKIFVRPYEAIHMPGTENTTVLLSGREKVPCIVRRKAVLVEVETESGAADDLVEMITNNELVAELVRVYREDWKDAKREAPPKSEVVVRKLMGRGCTRHEAECIDRVVRPTWAKKGGRKPLTQKPRRG